MTPTTILAESGYLAAGEALCPLMWEFAKDVGGSFNEAAADVSDLPAPADRQARWAAALAEMQGLVESVRGETLALDFPILDSVKPDIDAGADAALQQLESLQQLLDDTPEMDKQRHQVRTSQVIVRVEKVIDVVKPEMATYEDPNSSTPGSPSRPASTASKTSTTPRRAPTADNPWLSSTPTGFPSSRQDVRPPGAPR